MQLVKASYEILQDEDNPIDQIANRAVICYKTEPKETHDERKALLKRIWNHEPCFEMVVVHLLFELHNPQLMEILCESKYLHTTEFNDGFTLVTGSIRSWREFCNTHDDFLVNRIVTTLIRYNDFLFDDIEHSKSYSPATPPKLITDLEFLNLSPAVYKKHKHVAVKIITNRAVTHEIVRHRPVSYLQECIAGDVVVQSYEGGKKWTMEELYRIFSTPNCGLARKTIRIKTKDENNEIVPVQILNVFHSGKKTVYEVITKNGYKIKTSANHVYFTERGEDILKNISVGERVWLNGKTIEFDWLHEEYIVKNRQRKDIADEIGMSDCWLGKVIRNYGLQKPKTQYPNRQPGYGKKGVLSDEERKLISERMSGSNNHMWKGDDISERGGYSRSNKIHDLTGEICVCGSPAVERHHIDRNPRNNDSDNIEFCCVTCHKSRHKSGAKIAWLDEIVSIIEYGVEDTYDLEVDHLSHNFSANGFIVHNSQRYCNYSLKRLGESVQFIDPRIAFPKFDKPGVWDKWLNSMMSEEETYLSLINDDGLTAQAARTVLPNSCKTEIIVYCNLDEFDHIFNRRTPSAAEPSMREISIPLHKDFQEMFPGVITDKPVMAVG